MARKKSVQRLPEIGALDETPKRKPSGRGRRLQKLRPATADEAPKKTGTGVVGPRVSSIGQLKNEGSIRYQTDRAVRDLKERGVKNIAVVEMLGESGSKAKRPKFKGFLERIDAPDVTHVSIYDPGRAARKMSDFSEFLEIMKRRRITLIIDGHAVDPNNMNDELMLNIRALFAQYDNQVRVKASRDGKEELALIGTLRQRLAPGQVWASPSNEAYVDQMRKAGLLEQWMEDVQDYAYPSRTKEEESGKLYPGPIPDRKTYDALRRVVAIMLEEMSITRTRERIKADPILKGKIPTHKLWRWRSGVAVRWRRVTDQWLYRFFTCPATYGGLVIVKTEVDANGTPIVRPLFEAWGAFTGFAREEDRLRIYDVIEHPTRVRRNRTSKDARNCALDRVFCATPLPGSSGGSLCRQRMSACYRSERKGQYVYRSSGCSEMHRHHLAVPGAALDALVEQTIRQLLDPSVVESAVARLPLRADVVGETMRALRRNHEAAEERRNLKKRTFEAIDPEASPELYAEYAAELEQLTQEHSECQRKIAEHERTQASFAELADLDLDQVARLASDFNRLADLSREVEREGKISGVLRRLITEFVDRVDVAGAGLHTYNVTIRFRSGRQLTRQLFTAGMRVAHAELAYAVVASRSTGASVVAHELNGVGRRHKRLNRWTSGRVEGAALHWLDLGAPTQRIGPAETLAALAARVGVAEEDLLREAFAGRLGPGWIDGSSTVFGLTPSDADLARVFPAHARRAVAHEAGWPLAETVTIQRFADQHGHSAIKLRERVRQDPDSYGVREDAFGRTYMRADDLRRSYDQAVERALDALPPSCAAWRNLARDKWCVEADAARRTGVRCRTLIARGVPSIKIGCTLGDKARRLFWVDGWTVRRQRCPALAEAVADLGRVDVAVSDFMPSSQALARLQAIDPTITRRRWQLAIASGRLIRVIAQQDGTSARAVHWVYVPPEVLGTNDPNVIRAFLGGSRGRRAT